MKQVKPIPTSMPVPTNNRFTQYPIIGSLVGLFFLNSQLRVAQQVLKNSAQERQKLIRTADEAIEASERQIKETDALIAESQALRK